MDINDVHIKRLFDVLTFPDESEKNTKYITETLLKRVKELRGETSMETWSKQGVNIFNKRGVAISRLYDELLEIGLIRTYREMMQITTKGLLKYEEILTHNRSKEYQSFHHDVLQKVKELNTIPPSKHHIQQSFYNGENVQSIIQWCIEPNSVGDLTKRYHESLLRELGHSIESLEEFYILHLVPKLYLPFWEYKSEESEVSLKINGVKSPSNLRLTRPYPNRRYVVAGLMFGREQTAFGFYPLVIPKEQCPDEITIQYEWTVKNDVETYTVSHDLFIQLDKQSMGNVFSSYQRLVKGSGVPEFDLCTLVNANERPPRDGRDLQIKDVEDGVHIKEKATLVSLPMNVLGLNLASSYDKNYVERIEGDRL